jgi:hypothetical protein
MDIEFSPLVENLTEGQSDSSTLCTPEFDPYVPCQVLTKVNNLSTRRCRSDTFRVESVDFLDSLDFFRYESPFGRLNYFDGAEFR